jgi:hypothetical protein
MAHRLDPALVPLADPRVTAAGMLQGLPTISLLPERTRPRKASMRAVNGAVVVKPPHRVRHLGGLDEDFDIGEQCLEHMRPAN